MRVIVGDGQRWDQDYHPVGEEGRQADEEQQVVQKRHRVGVDVQLGELVVSQ